MAYTVLARKYRPQTFADVIGQEHVTRTLKNALTQGRIAHGYIFSGHRGIGKTTVARILAAALNCRSTDHPVPEPCGVCDSCTEIRAGNAVDVIEIDAATNRGIDEIRELRDAARYRPARDRFKVYILDEAHQITDAAFNALLKTLEEPPGHVIFMMATTQPEDIPQTIRSRCQHFSFHAVKFDDIVGQLRTIAGQEQIDAGDEALALLAEAGDGSMRDALSIMDQAIACCGQRLTGDVVRQLVGAVPSEVLEQMMAAVQRDSSEDALRLVDKLVSEGHNPVHFARQMVRFMRNTLVAKVAGSESPLLQISTDERARAARVAQMFSEEDLARFLQIVLRTHSELGYKQEQRFHLELGLLKLVHAQRLLPLEELLSGAKPAAPTQPPTAAASRAPAGPARTTQAVARPAATPFSADVARKGTPRSQAGVTARGDMSAAAAAPAVIPEVAASAPAAAPASTPEAVRERIVAALEAAEFTDLATMIGAGEWTLAPGELTVQVADAKALVDIAVTSEAQRALNAAAGSATGRATRVKVVGSANGGSRPQPARAASNSATRTNGATRTSSRVADEPVVRRLQEKFGAQVRSITDHREER